MTRLIALRKAHPVLRRNRFLHGHEASDSGVADITWFSPGGTEKSEQHWNDPHARCVGLMLNRAAGDHRAPDGRRAADDVLLIALNAHHDVVPFILPPINGAMGWRRLLDTTEPDLDDDQTIHPVGGPFNLAGRALVLFACEPVRGSG